MNLNILKACLLLGALTILRISTLAIGSDVTAPSASPKGYTITRASFTGIRNIPAMRQAHMKISRLWPTSSMSTS